MKKIFVIKENEDIGTIGLVGKNAPDEFQPLTGMGIAHDCLEHIDKDLGSVHNEFMALGAMFHICHVPSNGLVDLENIAVEIISICHSICMHDLEVKRPGYIIRNVSEEVVEIIKLMRRYLLDNYSDLAIEHDRILSCARHYMTLGYREAKKRIMNPYNTYVCFKSIERQVDSLLREYSDFDFIGAEVEIQYSFTKPTAKVTLLEDPYYNYG